MLNQFFILTLKGLRHRPVRSWLTILGVIIAVMLVVVILSLGSGVKHVVAQTMQMLGSDLIIIFPGKETNPLVGFIGAQKFRERDLLDLEKIEGVKFVLPMEAAMLNVEYRGDKKSAMIHAAPWDKMSAVLSESQGVRLEEGRWPSGDNVNETILGYLAAKSLFEEPVRIGDEIIIKSKRMKVVGTISEIGNQMDDNVIYISMKIYRSLTGLGPSAGSAIVKIEPDADVNLISKQIKFQLSKQDTVREFSILTPQKAEYLVGSVLAVIELVLMIIAFISLVVGAVGIMNTMYTSVLERTRQIGVMKAIGATSDAILSLFLIESGIIGFVGGLIGLLFGVGMAYLIGVIGDSFGVRGLFSFASLDFFGFFVVLVITFITGILAGILPARHASRMEPAEALRYE